MAFKAVTIVCALALVQSAFGQYLGGINGAGCGCGFANNGLGLGYTGLAGNGLGYAGLGYGAGLAGNGVASTGGGLPVASASPIAPVGVSVLSENAYEGSLSVGGNLPFLGTVGLEGVLPTAGAGAVSYGCGNGGVGIAVEEGAATGIAGPASFAGIGPYGAGFGAFGNGIAGLGAGIGYGAGIAGYGPYGGAGCGCGAVY